MVLLVIYRRHTQEDEIIIVKPISRSQTAAPRTPRLWCFGHQSRGK